MQRIKSICIIVFFFIFLNYNEFYSQTIHVEKISIPEGLSTTGVKNIFQDSYGLIWIATEDGLNVYDGYKIKVFKNIPGNSESILSSNTWEISEDKDRNLWVATEEGISKYIRSENLFINYETRDIIASANVSLARINFIFVDSKDNVWASTNSVGVIKYDRKSDKWEEIKVILSDTVSYYAPAIESSYPITEDSNGNIWVGSFGYGLIYYDMDENVFRQAEINRNSKTPNFAQSGNELTHLYSDQNNVLWITSRNGVYKYYPKTRELKTIETYSNYQLTFFAYYNGIIKDKDGNIWIANNFRGILKFDGISDNFKRIPIEGFSSYADGRSEINITNVSLDKTGLLWFGTSLHGIFKYNPDSEPFVHYKQDPQTENSINSSQIFSIAESKKYPGKIYVGTRGGGLNLFDPVTKSFSNIPFKVIKDVFGGSVRAILEEPDGSLWMGTWGDGLLKMNSSYEVVERYTFDSTNSNSLSDDQIRVIKKDNNGDLWVGGNVSLNLINGKTKKISRISDEILSHYPQEIYNLIKQKNIEKKYLAEINEVGDVQNLTQKFSISQSAEYLIVSAGEGVFRDSTMVDFGWIEDSKGKIVWSSDDILKSYHLDGATKNRIIVDIVKFTPGQYSLRYISDNSHGYNVWNADPPYNKEFWGIRIYPLSEGNESQSIRNYLKEAEGTRFIKGGNIRSIHISGDIVWIGSDAEGLNKYNSKTKEAKNYSYKLNNSNSLSNNSVQYIYEDPSGILWLATNGGLNKFDPKKEKFTVYTEEDGLPTDYIASILPGNNEDLWLSTRSGISKMVKDKSTGKITFVNYDTEDGLGGTDFIALVALKSKKGRYYFGGEHGLNEFGDVTVNQIPPALIFSDLKISNKSVLNMGNESPLKVSLFDLEDLTLSHTQNDLSFEFAALHYAKPSKNQYAHMLKGYDEDWIYDSKRFATYTNLDPGEYIFMIKGSNRDGVWNEEGKSIKITILPPWWLTTWAYVGYGFLFLGFIFLIDRVQRRRLLTKEKEKQKLLEAEHRIEAAELQAKATEAERKVLQVEYEMKKKELEEARELQLSMLPKELPELPHLDIAVYMKTATEVGGDYYDFHIGMDGTLTVVIGDATGHGMKAGTMVTTTKSLFSSHASNPDILFTFQEITRCIKHMNMHMLSMCLSILKIQGNKMQISAAGMPPALLYRSSTKNIEEIILKGMPLGAYQDFPYEIRETDIHTGDTLLLMSDGLPELFNRNREMFGYDRVMEIYKKAADKNPEGIIEELKNAGSEWVNNEAPDDDLTFVVIKVK
jgi:serine phosphatase RsbU (regulator of sigma subunit)/ligand-binding sensor domain-containing protein